MYERVDLCKVFRFRGNLLKNESNPPPPGKIIALQRILNKRLFQF